MAAQVAQKEFKKNWKQNYVLYPIYFTEQLEISMNRTYYLPFKIELPQSILFQESLKNKIPLEDYFIQD